MSDIPVPPPPWTQLQGSRSTTPPDWSGPRPRTCALASPPVRAACGPATLRAAGGLLGVVVRDAKAGDQPSEHEAKLAGFHERRVRPAVDHGTLAGHDGRESVEVIRRPARLEE